MYIYMYIYVDIYMYIYVYIHVHICKYINILIFYFDIYFYCNERRCFGTSAPKPWRSNFAF